MFVFVSLRLSTPSDNVTSQNRRVSVERAGRQNLCMAVEVKTEKGSKYVKP